MTTAATNYDSPSCAAALRTDTLLDSMMILLGLAVVQRLVGFCRAVLFCRWLDPEQLGQWEMAFSFLLLAAPLAVLALPGAFGRYVEHYHQQGQLRTFLRRTVLLCGGLASLALVLIYLARQWFSQLIFGTPDKAQLVTVLAVSLAAVIAFNFLVELFTALRNIRLVSIMQLVNSVTFAVVGFCLLLGWQCSAISVVLSYAAACLVAVGIACWWLRRVWKALPQVPQPMTQRRFWSKIAPFAGWILLVSLLANLFDIVDRYMIVHYSGMSPSEALRMVGNYHSSRVVPMLLISIAFMLDTVLLPHLSHDWEAGHRERVAARLRLILKLFGFGLVVAAVAVLFAAPLLFGVAFGGKFAAGLAVLPWTLTYCTWFAMAAVTQNYLWCAEKARLASLALLIGLLLNVGLNLLLLPRLGLLGAVLATTAANLVALVLICVFNHLLGFHLDRGVRVVFALPPAICLGPWIASLVLLAVVLEAVSSERLLSREEKNLLVAGWEKYTAKFRRLIGFRWQRHGG